MNKQTAIYEIENFIERTKKDLNQISQILSVVDEMEAERAELYWIAHILMALDDDDHDYIGGSFVTAEKTILRLREDNYEYS